MQEVNYVVPRSLFVFDFDHTIVDQNSDTCFYNRFFKGGELPADLSAQQVNGQWTAFMNSTLAYLREKLNVSSVAIEETIKNETCLVTGMREFLEKIKNAGNDIIICSDANSLFIEWIIQKQGLANLFAAVYTNPCTIDESDKLVVRRFFDHHTCQHCLGTPNLCKTRVIKEHIEKHAERYNEKTIIHYFGDGGNDFCPILNALQLPSCTGNIRKGFVLEKKVQSYLTKPEHGEFKCKLNYFSDANELIQFFKGQI